MVFDHAYPPENKATFDHANVRLSRKSRGKNTINSGNAALLRKPRDDGRLDSGCNGKDWSRSDKAEV